MKQTKRLLCLVLSLIMLVSLFPTAALATNLHEAAVKGEPAGDGALEVPNDDPVILSASEESPDAADVLEAASPAGGGADQSEAEGALDPDAPNGDEPVGDDIPGVPNDDATLDDEDEILRSAQDDEDVPEPVRVTFVCDPEETVVTVYDPAQPDENGEPTVIDPEEDGSWLLLPGKYLYDAECEGYVAAEKVEFEVSDSNQIIDVLLIISREKNKTQIGIPIRSLATSIGSSAFYNCNALTDVYYGGTEEQKDALIDNGWVTDGNDPFFNATWYYAQQSYISVTSFEELQAAVEAYNGEETYVYYNGTDTFVIEESITLPENFYFCADADGSTVQIPPDVTLTVSSKVTNAFYVENLVVEGTMSADRGAVYYRTLSGEISWLPSVVDSGTCGAEGDNLTWTLYDDGELVISGEGEMGYGSPWEDYKDDILSLTIESGVMSIGNSAFWQCEALTSVTIPVSVLNIGPQAFMYCGALTSVTIPSGVTSIAAATFYECGSLETVELPDSLISIGGSAFNNCGSLTNLTLPSQLQSIGGWAFSGCGLTEIEIPASVTSIGDSAFTCPALMNIAVAQENANYCSEEGVLFNKEMSAIISYPAGRTGTYAIPESVTSIGGGAFAECANLTGVALPSHLQSIGDQAFTGSGLTSIEIPASVTAIGLWVFSNCSSLTSITVAAANENYASWEGILFSKDMKQLLVCPTGKTGQLVIPEGVQHIENSAFANCVGLTEIKLPSSLTDIDISAFSGCTGLQSVTLQTGLTNILDSAFSGCSSLKNIVLPQGVKTICMWAFADCSSLENVTIPSSVEYIGIAAFSHCDALTDVYYGGTEEQKEDLTENGWNGWDYGWGKQNNESLFNAAWHYRMIVASGTCGAEGDNLSWTLYDDGELVVSGEGAMKDFESSYSAPWYGMEISTVTINSGVTRIGDSAFFECGGLASITIPDTVTSIGKWVFEYCSSLSSISIPDTVTSIGPYTFSDCSGLTAVTIPDAVTSIENGLFSGCTSLTEMTIPSDVTSVGSYAFSGCNSLASITIPATVTVIGEYAFNTCYSLLTVYYDGTAEQKEALIGNGWDPNGNDSLLYANWRFPSQAPEIVASGNCGSNASWSLDSDGTLTISGSGNMPNYMSPMSIPWHSYLNDITSVVVESGITNICRHAFHWCSNLTSVTLPETVTDIGAFAFADCTSLEEIVIPYGVISLAGGPFINCTSLASVTLPDTLTSIESNAFYGCTSLTSITIPDSLTNIGVDAFQNCSNLASFLAKPDSQVYSSQDGVLYNKDLTVLVLYPPAKDAVYTVLDGVTAIGKCAFSGVEVTDVTLPEGLLSIGQTAFAYCDALTGIVIPSSVTGIGDYAFGSSHALESVVILSDTTSIGVGAFHACTALSEVSYGAAQSALQLRSSLRTAAETKGGQTRSGSASIGKLAFDNCSSLTSITIPATVTSIGDAVFGYCTSLTDIFVDEQNPNYCSENGVLFTKDKTRLVAYPAGRSGSFDIPASVTNIDYAFYGCTSLTGVGFPASLTSIGDFAFYGCSGMSEFMIPDWITSLGTSVFRGCSALVSVTIPNGVTILGDELFMDCSSLPEITIPENVTSIGSNAFGSCYSLSTVVFKGDAPVIDAMAFFSDTATAWYPLDKVWTVDDMQSYGGTLSWIAYNPTVSENVVGAVSAGDLADGEIEAVTAALRETVNETLYTTIVIELVSQEQESGEEDTRVFEVHPAAVAYDGSTVVGAVEIENEQLSENASFTVILPVDKTWAGKTVAWTHVSEGYPDESGTAPVRGNETDGYYVAVSGITHFSTFALQLKGTVSLTGTVLSWNDNADVEVHLYSAETEDSVLNAAAQSGDYGGALKVGTISEITASGKQYACAFTLSDVEPGTYKLLMMKPGKYVPVIRTVELNEDTTLDAIALWLYGDVTADGKVNGTDALQIKRYFADISSIFMTGTEEVKAERLLAANVTALLSGDNKVNGTDALQIQRYFADISSVFMYMR